MCSIFKYRETVGRNYDYESSFGEKVRMIKEGEFDTYYDIVGVCVQSEKYPLMFDGMNSQGLVCGALAFDGYAHYYPIKKDMINVPSYDFVFQVLSTFDSVEEFLSGFSALNITDEEYSSKFPNSDLHWFIADKEYSIIVEQTAGNKLKWYGGEVMTNGPNYPQQDTFYTKTMKEVKGSLSSHQTAGLSGVRGWQTLNIPGDYTSQGRFTRLTYLKDALEDSNNNFNDVAQAFHLCSCVEQIYGATPIENKFEFTRYSIVYDMENLKVYMKPHNGIDVNIIDVLS